MTTLNLATLAVADSSSERRNGSAPIVGAFILQDDGTTDTTRRDQGSRFDGVAIEGGATIDTVDLTIFIFVGAGDDPRGLVAFEDVDDASQFVAVDGDVSDRIQTTENQTWNADNLGEGADSTFTGTDPGMISSLQEVIDRGSWASGNAVVLLLFALGVADKLLRAFAFVDKTDTDQERLDIDFTAAPEPEIDNLPLYGQVIFNSADEENRPRYGQRIARGAEE